MKMIAYMHTGTQKHALTCMHKNDPTSTLIYIRGSANDFSLLKVILSIYLFIYLLLIGLSIGT